MKAFNNIMVATDTWLEARLIVKEAAQIAHRNGAKLKLVDVVPESPSIARIMVSDRARMQQLIGRQKLEKLESLAAAYRDESLSLKRR